MRNFVFLEYKIESNNVYKLVIPQKERDELQKSCEEKWEGLRAISL
jgi:hypothetical protein